MSKLTQIPRIGLDVSIRLNESEVRALEALAGYGIDGFLEVFYEKMGRSYLKPHEQGLRSLFSTIQETLPPILRRLDVAQQAFCLQDPVLRSRKEHDELISRLVENANKATKDQP